MDQTSPRRSDSPLMLVTGVTGYIGGRLVPLLLEAGFQVRCMVRDPTRLEGRPWRGSAEVVTGDALEPESLVRALKDVKIAYYLIHSLGAGSDFHDRDLRAAENFGAAARRAGVERIIYLGALAESSPTLSKHLTSRQETGDVLRRWNVPVTEFRAGVIVGSGSLSFELIRYLTERLPLLICPRWVFTRTQPIGVREVLEYLVAAPVTEESTGLTIEIGGSDVIPYGEMMMTYAEVRGLRRWMLPVPLLSPHLSSHWINFVTPIPITIARPLIDGLRNESVVRDFSARRLFPGIMLVGYRTSVARALARLDAGTVETSWSDALSTSLGDIAPVVLKTEEGMIIENRQCVVPTKSEHVYRVFSGIGGHRGWYCMNWAWEVRGFIDRQVGGVGLRRGRRHPDELRVGDALDFWRVEAIEPGRTVRLRAEMVLPGEAWLQFQVQQRENGESLLSQTAFFAPKGLMGWLYWYGLYPFHALIFRGLIAAISRRAVALECSPKKPVQETRAQNT